MLVGLPSIAYQNLQSIFPGFTSTIASVEYVYCFLVAYNLYYLVGHHFGELDMILYAYTDIFRWKRKDLLTNDASINNIHADQLYNAISPPS